MITYTSEYTFVNEITENTGVAGKGANTICFENQGEQNVIIGGSYKLKPNSSKTFGGRENCAINQNFDIAFEGIGSCSLFVIYEIINPNK